MFLPCLSMSTNVLWKVASLHYLKKEKNKEIKKNAVRNSIFLLCNVKFSVFIGPEPKKNK